MHHFFTAPRALGAGWGWGGGGGGGGGDVPLLFIQLFYSYREIVTER